MTSNSLLVTCPLTWHVASALPWIVTIALRFESLLTYKIYDLANFPARFLFGFCFVCIKNYIPQREFG